MYQGGPICRSLRSGSPYIYNILCMLTVILKTIHKVKAEESLSLCFNAINKRELNILLIVGLPSIVHISIMPECHYKFR